MVLQPGRVWGQTDEAINHLARFAPSLRMPDLQLQAEDLGHMGPAQVVVERLTDQPGAFLNQAMGFAGFVYRQLERLGERFPLLQLDHFLNKQLLKRPCGSGLVAYDGPQVVLPVATSYALILR